MKRLWKHIPPCLSDVMGFQAVMTQTDGLGIIDDPGRYKPLSTVGVGDAMPMHMNAGKPGVARAGYDGRDGFRGDRGGFGGGGRGGRGGGGRGSVPQVTDSALRNEDIISGTEKKIIQAFEDHRENDPKFVFVCNAPSSAMISSDVESAAISISEIGHIPAGSVKIYGEKDYLFGVSQTLDGIARLLLNESEKIPNSVNILGCNIIDWNQDSVDTFTEMIEAEGIKVIGKWGAAGMTCEILKTASKASLNIVVNISGLKVAQYMKSEYGIPYIAGAPFGNEQCSEMIGLIKTVLADPDSDNTAAFLDKSKSAEADCEAMIMGEQFTANAIRRVLKNKGYTNIRVLSFFEMDKNYMEPGDKKIISEDEMKELTSSDSLRLIAANPDYRGAAGKECAWIELPNSGMAMMKKINQVNMIGGNLDKWIDENL